MTWPSQTVRAGLLGIMVGCAAAWSVPPFEQVWPEPSPEDDPFYYVDYEKSDHYHRRQVNSALWPWGVGLAAGLPVGLLYCWVCRPRLQKDAPAS